MGNLFKPYTEEEVLNWIDGGGLKVNCVKESPKKKTSFRKKELHLCPKSDKCIMECPHKVPHTFDGYCDPESNVNVKAHGDNPCECPKCVRELAADITFFEEDFEL